MTQNTWLIYGANGYTGNLIAREAKRKNINLILAGRNPPGVLALAQELGTDCRIFTLEDPKLVAQKLIGVVGVMHCAGPFSSTASVMMQACLLAKVHYLDITGEISVFEYAQTLKLAADNAKTVICPGVGFDVVPTDCLAAKLKAVMPDATHLALGFDSRSSFSPGTAKTSVEGLAQGGRVRLAGVITSVPLAYKTRHINFGNGEKLAMSIPWGDVSTAYYTTGIANIEVFIPASPNLVKKLTRLNWIRPLLGLSFVQNLMKKQITKKVRGPDATAREKAQTFVWGEVRNASNTTKTARMTVPNGYSLTVLTSVAVMEHLNAHAASGVHTPSSLMGADFISHIAGVSEMVISDR